jgi:hypothetical protein
MGAPSSSIDRKRLRRDDGFMAAHGWGRVGWAVFVAALIGLTGYMISAGWNQANLIAGVAGFFVAVVGLALAVADRYRSPVSRELSALKISAGTLTSQARLGSESGLAGLGVVMTRFGFAEVVVSEHDTPDGIATSLVP